MDINDVVLELENEVQGQMAFAFHDLRGNRSVLHRSDVPIATASTYKLPLLVYLALAVAEGEASWHMPLVLTDTVKSRGTGILRGLTSGLQLPLKDVCYLMIALSDNTATDMLIDHFGIEGVNLRLKQLGLQHTRLELQKNTEDSLDRMPLAAGTTTPNEMAGLLKDLVSHKYGYPETMEQVLGMLSAQQDRSMIPRFLPRYWQYAGKTGCNDDLRADVGLVTSPNGNCFLLSVFCQHPPTADWSVDSPGTLAVARLARALLFEN